jgi:Domain of unknown function (DUF2017)
MKIGLTLNGGMRIDAESAEDWQILRYLPYDARPQELAERLTAATEEDTTDWRDYVLPDLQESFTKQVAFVYHAIEKAAVDSSEQAGPLFVEKQDALNWYGALNQARLTLHTRYVLPLDEGDLLGIEPERRGAYYRSDFYCIIQSLLIEKVL